MKYKILLAMLNKNGVDKTKKLYNTKNINDITYQQWNKKQGEFIKIFDKNHKYNTTGVELEKLADKMSRTKKPFIFSELNHNLKQNEVSGLAKSLHIKKIIVPIGAKKSFVGNNRGGYVTLWGKSA